MNIHHQARHIGIAGKSGMGKTTYALRYIQGSHHDRVFIFDHQGEFRNRIPTQEGQVCVNVADLPAAVEKFRVVIYDPALEFAGNFEEGFEWFCEFVLGVCEHHTVRLGWHCLFVCDEIQKFCSPANCSFQFKAIVETGRRQMLDSLTLSQRPNAINPAIREQYTELIMFRLTDENSSKFASWAGADTDLVRQLPAHHFLFFNVMSGDERPGELVFGGEGKN